MEAYQFVMEAGIIIKASSPEMAIKKLKAILAKNEIHIHDITLDVEGEEYDIKDVEWNEWTEKFGRNKSSEGDKKNGKV